MKNNNIKAYILLSTEDEIKELESNLINFNVLPEDVKKFTTNKMLDLVLNLTKEDYVVEIIDDDV